jgi:2-polyprenyl-6-methoxyphenol hydroxylase-like FAD-dependent oxidoreductase
MRKASVIGAGIAGLTAASALAARGWSVDVFERSPAIRAYGSGIYLWENGLRVLEAVGALDQAVEGAHWGVERETRNHRNELTGRHVFESSSYGRVVTILRQQLMDALAGAAVRAGAHIHLAREALRVEPDGSVEFANGDTERFDLVVVADGVHSRARDSLGLLQARYSSGDGAIRFMIPRTEEERASPAGQRYVEYWSGTRRLLYTPCNSRYVYLALTALNDDEEARRTPFPHEVWARSFPHLAPLIGRIDTQGRWDNFETIRLHSWSRGVVAVIGDAAHAQPPNLGQGGGCALMNGLSLATYVSGGCSIEDALVAWERKERPLIEHTQRMSGILSAVTTLSDNERSAFFKKATRSNWFTRQRWKTLHHVPTGTTAAKVSG